MDQKLSNLRRLAGSDPGVKERYIHALERIVGLGDIAKEGKLKCVGCVNCADQGLPTVVLKPGKICDILLISPNLEGSTF